MPMKKIGIVLIVLLLPVCFFAKFGSSSSNNNNNNIINGIIVGFIPTVSEPWWIITSSNFNDRVFSEYFLKLSITFFNPSVMLEFQFLHLPRVERF
jgi:hypothetical protein